MTHLICPECGPQYRWPDSGDGTVRCPDCGSELKARLLAE